MCSNSSLIDWNQQPRHKAFLWGVSTSQNARHMRVHGVTWRGCLKVFNSWTRCLCQIGLKGRWEFEINRTLWRTVAKWIVSVWEVSSISKCYRCYRNMVASFNNNPGCGSPNYVTLLPFLWAVFTSQVDETHRDKFLKLSFLDIYTFELDDFYVVKAKSSR